MGRGGVGIGVEVRMGMGGVRGVGEDGMGWRTW